jgi:transposase InsO family protein
MPWRTRQEAERLHGPLEKPPFLVTDNGPSFLARRFGNFIKAGYQHVQIRYRTPQQLGLLERFHQTLKTEEVYWRIYTDPMHARSAWPISATVTRSWTRGWEQHEGAERNDIVSRFRRIRAGDQGLIAAPGPR